MHHLGRLDRKWIFRCFVGLSLMSLLVACGLVHELYKVSSQKETMKAKIAKELADALAKDLARHNKKFKRSGPTSEITQTGFNWTCVSFVWTPFSLNEVVEIQISISNVRTPGEENRTATLGAFELSYEFCDLDPYTPYKVTVVATGKNPGASETATAVLWTMFEVPPTPSPPKVISTTDTTITVELPSVTLDKGPFTAIEVRLIKKKSLDGNQDSSPNPWSRSRRRRSSTNDWLLRHPVPFVELPSGLRGYPIDDRHVHVSKDGPHSLVFDLISDKVVGYVTPEGHVTALMPERFGGFWNLPRKLLKLIGIRSLPSKLTSYFNGESLLEHMEVIKDKSKETFKLSNTEQAKDATSGIEPAGNSSQDMSFKEAREKFLEEHLQNLISQIHDIHDAETLQAHAEEILRDLGEDPEEELLSETTNTSAALTQQSGGKTGGQIGGLTGEATGMTTDRTTVYMSDGSGGGSTDKTSMSSLGGSTSAPSGGTTRRTKYRTTDRMASDPSLGPMVVQINRTTNGQNDTQADELTSANANNHSHEDKYGRNNSQIIIKTYNHSGIMVVEENSASTAVGLDEAQGQTRTTTTAVYTGVDENGTAERHVVQSRQKRALFGSREKSSESEEDEDDEEKKKKDRSRDGQILRYPGRLSVDPNELDMAMDTWFDNSTDPATQYKTGFGFFVTSVRGRRYPYFDDVKILRNRQMDNKLSNALEYITHSKFASIGLFNVTTMHRSTLMYRIKHLMELNTKRWNSLYHEVFDPYRTKREADKAKQGIPPGYDVARVQQHTAQNITVGDGKTHGNIPNPPLAPNTQYEVIMVVLSTVADVTKHSWSSVTVTTLPQNQKVISPFFAVLVGAFMAIVLFVTILSCFMLWCGRRRPPRDDPEGDYEDYKLRFNPEEAQNFMDQSAMGDNEKSDWAPYGDSRRTGWAPIGTSVSGYPDYHPYYPQPGVKEPQPQPQPVPQPSPHQWPQFWPMPCVGLNDLANFYPPTTLTTSFAQPSSAPSTSTTRDSVEEDKDDNDEKRDKKKRNQDENDDDNNDDDDDDDDSPESDPYGDDNDNADSDEDEDDEDDDDDDSKGARGSRSRQMSDEDNTLPDYIRKVYRPEVHWNRTYNVDSRRYLTAKRENLRGSLSYTLEEEEEDSDTPARTPVTFKDEFQSLRDGTDFSSNALDCSEPVRNRFPHIALYENSRVVLSADSSSNSTTIHANFIPGYSSDNLSNSPTVYIAAMSPFNPETVLDFWRMIYQHEVTTVVMLTNVVEDGIVKCAQYWPAPSQDVKTFGHFLLQTVEEHTYAEYVVRKIKLRSEADSGSRDIMQFQMTSCPSQGMPDCAVGWLDFRLRVRNFQLYGPLLVHCGTGVSRTAVYIALDILIEEYSEKGSVSVYACVQGLRQYRALMVRSLDQYMFIYKALLEDFQAGDPKVSLDQGYNQVRADLDLINPKTGNTYLEDQFDLLNFFSMDYLCSDVSVARQLDNRNQRKLYIKVSDRPLQSGIPWPGFESLNAVFIDSYRTRDLFALMDTPSDDVSIDEFWKFLRHYGVRTVVQLGREGNKSQNKHEEWKSSRRPGNARLTHEKSQKTKERKEIVEYAEGTKDKEGNKSQNKSQGEPASTDGFGFNTMKFKVDILSVYEYNGILIRDLNLQVQDTQGPSCSQNIRHFSIPNQDVSWSKPKLEDGAKNSSSNRLKKTKKKIKKNNNKKKTDKTQMKRIRNTGFRVTFDETMSPKRSSQGVLDDTADKQVTLDPDASHSDSQRWAYKSQGFGGQPVSSDLDKPGGNRRSFKEIIMPWKWFRKKRQKSNIQSLNEKDTHGEPPVYPVPKTGQTGVTMASLTPSPAFCGHKPAYFYPVVEEAVPRTNLSGKRNRWPLKARRRSGLKSRRYSKPRGLKIRKSTLWSTYGYGTKRMRRREIKTLQGYGFTRFGCKRQPDQDQLLIKSTSKRKRKRQLTRKKQQAKSRVQRKMSKKHSKINHNKQSTRYHCEKLLADYNRNKLTAEQSDEKLPTSPIRDKLQSQQSIKELHSPDSSSHIELISRDSCSIGERLRSSRLEKLMTFGSFLAKLPIVRYRNERNLETKRDSRNRDFESLGDCSEQDHKTACRSPKSKSKTVSHRQHGKEPRSQRLNSHVTQRKGVNRSWNKNVCQTSVPFHCQDKLRPAVLPNQILQLLELVLDWQTAPVKGWLHAQRSRGLGFKPEEVPRLSPVVIHSPEGSSEAAIFCACANICERMQENQEVDVYHVIKQIRSRCPKAVHCFEDYEFLYDCLEVYISDFLDHVFASDRWRYRAPMDIVYSSVIDEIHPQEDQTYSASPPASRSHRPKRPRSNRSYLAKRPRILSDNYNVTADDFLQPEDTSDFSESDEVSNCPIMLSTKPRVQISPLNINDSRKELSSDQISAKRPEEVFVNERDKGNKERVEIADTDDCHALGIRTGSVQKLIGTLQRRDVHNGGPGIQDQGKNKKVEEDGEDLSSLAGTDDLPHDILSPSGHNELAEHSLDLVEELSNSWRDEEVEEEMVEKVFTKVEKTWVRRTTSTMENESIEQFGRVGKRLGNRGGFEPCIVESFTNESRTGMASSDNVSSAANRCVRFCLTQQQTLRVEETDL